MKIVSVEPIVLKIPFSDGSSGKGLFPSAWNELEIVLVKITSDNGIVAWGEGFGYFCSKAVASMVTVAYAPLLIGKEVDDIFSISEELQRKSVLPGRYGISTFGLSGVDIALWDLKSKNEGVSIAALLGKQNRNSVNVYASLVRYGDTNLVVEHAEKALKEGYSEIKLHEITLPEIKAVREAIGAEIAMTVDVNCNWLERFTRDAIPQLIELNTKWLEEPIFPPEDFRLLAELSTMGLPIAAGENACTSVQFSEMIRMGAVDYIQPSITKVGGVSECQKIRRMNSKSKVSVAPHSPYFGPGYLATLQMAAIDEFFTVFEYLYVQPQQWIYKDMPLPQNGVIEIPDKPGLGMDPDPESIAKYRIKIK